MKKLFVLEFFRIYKDRLYFAHISQFFLFPPFFWLHSFGERFLEEGAGFTKLFFCIRFQRINMGKGRVKTRNNVLLLINILRYFY